MTHDADAIGLASWVVLNHLIADLDRIHPGMRKRVLNAAVASVQANPGRNTDSILAVISDVNV